MIEFKDGLAQDAGEISVHLFDSSNGEYQGTGTAYVSLGFSLPTGATLKAPPEAQEGQVAVWQGDVWELLADHRGRAYKTADGVAVDFSELGELPDTLTLLPRPSPAYVWGGADWQLDAELDLAIKTMQEQLWISQQLNLAGGEVLKHEDQDPTAVASEAAWRQYRVELRAWPQQASFPDTAGRPTAPDRQPEGFTDEA